MTLPPVLPPPPAGSLKWRSLTGISSSQASDEGNYTSQAISERLLNSASAGPFTETLKVSTRGEERPAGQTDLAA
ncbi:hypothetical protein SKAU_G00044120 [Synaphobranchus kaupii]|uniref:Uncharacterized protein n=1 Tax=Synaphobranchus kaupii TaxID=118154 RepID=A0A9Q1J941_SYNKA|nr:hypothetical protein SKAU_G00044120 [Synaphobranchus kaupii]